jgi:hypothetical protein
MDPLTMFSDTVQMHFACSLWNIQSRL